jgi:hypothetical protein
MVMALVIPDLKRKNVLMVDGISQMAVSCQIQMILDTYT